MKLFSCEAFATEFKVQGPKLDWIGLCWRWRLYLVESWWLALDMRYGINSK